MNKTIVLFLTLFLLYSFKQDSSRVYKLIEQAIQQTKTKVVYDPSYVKLDYPNGDVPKGTGVCTDLIIRAYRGIGLDLQKEVHLDMKKNFEKYPKLWKLKAPDPNIDHRRVPNLMIYFERKNAKLKIGDKSEDYKPGDLVTWNLQNKNSMSGITHIGMVTNIKSMTSDNWLIAHNIGSGNVLEDMLFDYTIIGHYRFLNY